VEDVHIFSFAPRGPRDGIRKAHINAARSRERRLSRCRRLQGLRVAEATVTRRSAPADEKKKPACGARGLP
jgi:hypothetical protein